MNFHEENIELINKYVIEYVDLIKDYFKKNGRNETIKMVHNFVDKLYLRNEVTDATSCKKGCSFCCHDTIYVHPSEMDYIRDMIKAKGIKPNYKQSKQYSSKLKKDLKWIDKKCPMLDNDGFCKIYEFRPLVCRSHNSTDDPIKCIVDGPKISHGQVYSVEAEAMTLALFLSTNVKGLEGMDVLNKIKKHKNGMRNV